MGGKISTKQQEILDYIKDEILRKGYPPTVREICETVHLKSTSSVHSHLESLEKNGYIQRLLHENEQLRYEVELLRGKVHILTHKAAAQGEELF